MNTINALLQLLSGKKTYLTSIAIGVLLFGNWQHWWQIPSEVYLALMAAAVAFLRAGVAKGPADPPANDPAPTNSSAASSSVKLPLALFAFASLALMIISCSTTTPQKVAYQAAGTTVVSVDTAMDLWGAYVAANHPSTNVEMQVRTLTKNIRPRWPLPATPAPPMPQRQSPTPRAAHRPAWRCSRPSSTAGQT